MLSELGKIPSGTTALLIVRKIARRIRRPKAVRAVGAANGRNPLPIVIPCHRVIGGGGQLTGFGGGLPAREHLLRLEMEHSRFPHVG
ncbi:MAG: methylated-DNA--[protein]-cysteine S-methyltransferase [Woeseiaceae bacterium]|nr:methylated-DNA--[protein]-cysteine S-methyltransferase [Woeseiaceae bacterium]